MTIESPTDGDVFLVFVEKVLGPKLQAGSWVIMDNLRARKVEGVREQIETRGASLVYLPPYSPTSIPSNRSGRDSCGIMVQQRHAVGGRRIAASSGFPVATFAALSKGTNSERSYFLRCNSFIAVS